MQFCKRISSLFLLIALLTACATGKTMTVAATASLLEDVANASYKQSDLVLIRRGMPSYLMLIDGMVEALREAGQTVWYMNALNEGHSYDKKENRDLFQQATVLFLQKYLLGGQ